jgi:hypothetical protein
VFLLALASTPLLGAGWFWSVGNGFGLAALCCMAWLCLDTRRGGKVRSHQLLGYWACGFLLAHLAWFLLGDRVSWEYLKTSAPAWMWSGWLALALVLLLVISSARGLRPRAYTDHPGFRLWHRLLTAAALAASVHHLAGSGFYLREWYQWCLLAALLATCLLLPVKKDRAVPKYPVAGALTWLALLVLAFVGIKNLPL